MSRELFEDLADGGTEEFSQILSQAYQSFQAVQTITGSGSGAPYGIFTSLTSTSGTRVSVASSSAVASADVEKLYQSLPDKFRQNAIFLCHPTVLTQVRQSDSGAAVSIYHDSDSTGPRLAGIPVLTSLACPAFTGTTANSAYLALVDVQDGFIVAGRAPSILEVADTYDQATGRPNYGKVLISSVRTAQGLIDTGLGRILANY
jgi:HK97 family phage major capsid protein